MLSFKLSSSFFKAPLRFTYQEHTKHKNKHAARHPWLHERERERERERETERKRARARERGGGGGGGGRKGEGGGGGGGGGGGRERQRDREMSSSSSPVVVRFSGFLPFFLACSWLRLLKRTSTKERPSTVFRQPSDRYPRPALHYYYFRAVSIISKCHPKKSSVGAKTAITALQRPDNGRWAAAHRPATRTDPRANDLTGCSTRPACISMSRTR